MENSIVSYMGSMDRFIKKYLSLDQKMVTRLRHTSAYILWVLLLEHRAQKVSL